MATASPFFLEPWTLLNGVMKGLLVFTNSQQCLFVVLPSISQQTLVDNIDHYLSGVGSYGILLLISHIFQCFQRGARIPKVFSITLLDKDCLSLQTGCSSDKSPMYEAVQN